jgi:hypothetical protein
MSLPLKLPYDQMQTKWKSEIDPVLANPLNAVLILKNISLVAGKNVINHKLGQTQQGWFLVDKQGPGDVYRTAPFTDLTLTLTSTTAMVVNIGVY